MDKLLSLYELAEAEKISTWYYPFSVFNSVLIRLDGKSVIGIDPNRVSDIKSEIDAIGHELGHHFTGSFYTPDADQIDINRAENRASKWYINHIIPKEDIIRLMNSDYRIWEIADYFEVSEDTIKKAIKIYKL